MHENERNNWRHTLTSEKSNDFHDLDAGGDFAEISSWIFGGKIHLRSFLAIPVH